MADIPAPLTFGTIIGHYIAFGADSADVGSAPDAETLNGTVTITPNVRIVRVATPAINYLAVQKDIVAKIVNGVLYGPDGSTTLSVLATDSPGVSPEGWQYTATYALAGVTAQPAPVTFSVPTGEEVDLAEIFNPTPAPAVQTVVVSDEALKTLIAQEVDTRLGSGEVSDVALSAHINSTTPHPAYDVDAPSFTLLIENGLV